MIMLASGGHETENKMELQQSLSYYYHTDLPSKLHLCFPYYKTLFFTASVGWSHKADADQHSWSHSHNSVPYPVLANVAPVIPGTSAAGTKPLCLTAIQ